MKRKYIYIIVFLLAIIVSVGNYYVELSLNEPKERNELYATYNLEPNIFDDLEEENSFYSALITSPLTIKNYQNDDEVITYTYNLKIDNIHGAYRYNKDNKEGYIVFSANGEATLKLNSNESITIYDIPSDKEYWIEQVTNVKDKYTTKINDIYGTSGIGTINLETEITIENNTRNGYVKPTPENPENPDSNHPVEEQPKPEKNPITGDSFYYIIIILTITIGVLFTLAKMKVKRFE